MLIIDNIKKRSEVQKSYILNNVRALNSAINANLLFAVDEYIVSIFNTFFSDNRSIPEDESILNELIKYSKLLGNDRNTKIIEHELNNIEQNLYTNINYDLTFPLKVILPENIRTELRSLKTITKNYELGLENKYIQSDFDYNKYVDNFDNRFKWSLENYKRISTKNSSSILDIGTGMGYIPYIFKHNGYDVS